ncbi:phosphoribosylformylglycinamidine synthase subunit PurS [Sulfurovum sp. bin170]|uniref:phosphoribosylformylglycinamidine synthase subunit PurS n=1 Tax=Sulfurovum sp. bin170 TaxID=2695268 RepID=UPI0013E07D53|nr:phosphoribosylformylglycinamidine synthase subunit PurS [Sulfurovum sp. bin170]NEW60187.1 phosphoribosylformylglycinamidine synthase subunit PurS [Sulfurovum sp. bin170]
MKAIVNIFLKEGVLDPQGKAIHHALDAMNFEGVEDVRMGKQIVLKLTSTSRDDALQEVEKMAEDILANTVIEDYTIELI